jgi:hypothetical protein
MWNPIRSVLRSQSPRGVKLIALSLMLVISSALPFMVYSLFGDVDRTPNFLSWIFALGALVAHLGFFIGVILLIWDMYFAKK